MVDLVNPYLPVEKRFKSAGRHPGNPSGVSLTNEYNRLHPRGPLSWRYRCRMALSLISFLFWVGCLWLYAWLGSRH